MNDLSVLFPLPKSQQEVDAMVAPTAAALGGALLPQAVYASDLDTNPDYASLRVVGFRVDPCFGQLGPIVDPSTCENQLRLVFQPILFDTAASAEDSAIHAFYSLTRAQLINLVNEIVDARLAAGGDADLGPLAPHPIVVREGLTGELAQRLVTILTTYVGAGNLVRFTALQELEFDTPQGPNDVSGFWDLHGVDIANGATTPMQIATLPAGTTVMNLNTSSQPLLANESPVTTSNDNITLLMDFTQASQATMAQRQVAFDAALRIENPADNSPNTIDCASCHLAQPVRQLVGEQLGLTAAGDPSAFVAASSIPSADLVQTTNLLGADGGVNVHAFSYRLTDPMINQRVINETAANLAYIATLVQ
jgi:hypothetical protein